MLTYEQFADCVRQEIPRLQQRWLNQEQEDAVKAAPDPPTFIVAGPGTGKTTVLALRTLKLVLVDRIPPEGIVATTFTRKAAAELRSRILAWGYATIFRARREFAENSQIFEWLSHIDINGVQTGTLDSLSEQFLAACRPPGGITPATIEAFLARAFMRRFGLFPNGRFRSRDLENFLATFVPRYPGPTSFPLKLAICLSFADRARHDHIDLGGFVTGDAGRQVLSDVLSDYYTHIEANHFADFARLETLLLDRLQCNQLQRVTTSLRAILIDEFQDTNYLQEQIYFESCRRTGASLTVVGDDDQSVFRFRGATVEIFAAFEQRIVHALGVGWRPQRFDLVRNYRSSRPVVEFCNHFVQLDANYQPARVPGKQPLIASATHAGEPHPPVLGMFRANADALANDLAQFLADIFRGNGVTVICAGNQFQISRSPNGEFGDAVLLTHSAREYGQGNPPRQRLPLLLRNILEGTHQVPVFNPRGRSLFEIQPVRLLLGLSLLCIDGDGQILQNISHMKRSARARILSWRQDALYFVQASPAANGLQAFIQSWQTRTLPPNSGFRDWPSEWPLLELLFTLLTWIPSLQSEPEGQVYLEAIARTVSQAGQLSVYRAQILHGAAVHDQNSIVHSIREVFENIADENVEVDEEIMPYVPRSYFPIMTIHQAKGLEFPLVIVDVGSDFRMDHYQQRRLRFPEQPDTVHIVEDLVAPFCPVGPARAQRAAIDRAWDDLRRLYYVAYSRPENVLLLVGLTGQLRNPNPIRAVATGDTGDLRRALTLVPAAQWHAGMLQGAVALI